MNCPVGGCEHLTAPPRGWRTVSHLTAGRHEQLRSESTPVSSQGPSSSLVLISKQKQNPYLHTWASHCPIPLWRHTGAFGVPSAQTPAHRRTHSWTHCGNFQRYQEGNSHSLSLGWTRLRTGKLRHQNAGQKMLQQTGELQQTGMLGTRCVGQVHAGQASPRGLLIIHCPQGNREVGCVFSEGFSFLHSDTN